MIRFARGDIIGLLQEDRERERAGHGDIDLPGISDVRALLEALLEPVVFVAQLAPNLGLSA